MGTPLTLYSYVDKGAMLNVGNANLTYLSYDMCFNPNTGRRATARRPTPSRAPGRRSPQTGAVGNPRDR